MSGLDLYEKEAGERVNRLTPIERPEVGTWDGFLRGTGMATMRTFAKTARAVDMVGSIGPIVQDAFTGGTAAQDRYFKEHDEVFGSAVDFWTPKPGEVGMAGEITGQLLATIPLVVTSPSLVVGATQMDTAEDLVRKGVDPTKAQAVGAAQAAGLGLGIYMPIFGKSLWQRMLVGGAGFNVVQGAAMRGVSEQILNGTAAEGEFKMLDSDAFTLDLLLGAAFGGISHLSPRQRAEGERMWKKLEEWGIGVKPEGRDALASLRQAQHSNVDSLPGRPLGAEDMNAHVERVRAAVDQLVRDERVEVSDLPAARVEPDAKRWAEGERRAAQIVKEAEKLGKELDIAPAERPTVALRIGGELFEARPGEFTHGQILNRLVREQPEVISPDPQTNRNIEDGWTKGGKFLTRDQAMAELGYDDTQSAAGRRAAEETVDAPVTRDAGTPPSASGEPARPAATDKPVDPLAAEADRIATERPELQVTTGLDEAGLPVRKTVKQVLDDARAETAKATEEAKLLQVAAECMLGVA